MGQNSAPMRDERRNKNKGRVARAELMPEPIRMAKAPSMKDLNSEVGNLPSIAKGSVKRIKSGRANRT